MEPSGWTQRLPVILGSESAWRGEAGELVHLDPEAPPCGGRILERETNPDPNPEPVLSVRNKAGGVTRSLAQRCWDRCSPRGGRLLPRPMQPVLINSHHRRLEGAKPSLLSHKLSVPNFGNALLFQSQYSESCAACAKGFQCCRRCPSATSAVPRQPEKPGATSGSRVSLASRVSQIPYYRSQKPKSIVAGE